MFGSIRFQFPFLGFLCTLKFTAKVVKPSSIPVSWITLHLFGPRNASSLLQFPFLIIGTLQITFAAGKLLSIPFWDTLHPILHPNKQMHRFQSVLGLSCTLETADIDAKSTSSVLDFLALKYVIVVA